MRKSGKQLLAIAILFCCISTKCLAQTKNSQAKVEAESKEVGVSKKVVNAKKPVLSKAVVAPKTDLESKIALDSKKSIEAKKSTEVKKSVDAKKVVEIQKAALKDGILNMSVVAEAPPLPAEVYSDSVALVKNLIVKPYKVNSHASYYHDKLNGKRTASGKPFDNKKFTAAHRTFPFGTQLRLTNTLNNKSVVVVVNDRGPFVKSREIDITKAAFMQLATNKNNGSVNITIEVVQ